MMLARRAFACILFACSIGLHAEDRVIRIATLEYPPFIYSENNQVKGPVAQVVMDAFEQLGYRPVIEVLPISRGLVMVETGEVDAYFSLKKTAAREKVLLFTQTPLLQQTFVLFTLADSKIEWHGKLEDLRKYRIGVARNTSYGPKFDTFAKENPQLGLDEATSFEQNFKKLLAGRIDVLINSYDVGQELVHRLGASQAIYALSPPVEIVNSYLAFTKVRDYTELARELDGVLAKARVK